MIMMVIIMKKVLWILLIIGILSININKEEKEEKRAIFISYIELQEKIKGKEENVAKRNIKEMIDNIKAIHFNTIILQVRPNTDSIYPSIIYPYSLSVVEKEEDKSFDILKEFIELSHKQKIEVIAWINPFRISRTEQIEDITPLSPAYKYLNTDIIYKKDGIYWNPSKKETKKVLLAGIKELLTYPIDGLLMDDYFYPDNEIDRKDYELLNTNLTIEEYHLEVINKIIEEIHTICKKNKIPFGISPDGNIENNYQKEFADVKKWMSTDKYIDFIMPQIYYGFYNSTKAYVNTVKEWEQLLTNDKVDLYIALAFYKVGKEDYYAKEGRNEWLENNNIIMREVILSRNRKNYKGFSLFRYDNVFEDTQYTNNSKLELENLQKIIKK